MWTYESFIAKARSYLARAREHPRADDTETGIWLLLGLEFLLRAPVAKVHPVLLADHPNAALAAAGVDGTASLNGANRSIAIKAVIDRLPFLIEDFDATHVADALFLVDRRNEELHSGHDALVIESHEWLPRFVRVAGALCDHLALNLEEMIGRGILHLGEQLATIQNKRIAHDVALKIRAARARSAHMSREEKRTREHTLTAAGINAALSQMDEWAARWTVEEVICPVCSSKSLIRFHPIRVTNPYISRAGKVVRDLVLLAADFDCNVCELLLSGAGPIASAGLPTQRIEVGRDLAPTRWVLQSS